MYFAMKFPTNFLACYNGSMTQGSQVIKALTPTSLHSTQNLYHTQAYIVYITDKTVYYRLNIVNSAAVLIFDFLSVHLH